MKSIRSTLYSVVVFIMALSAFASAGQFGGDISNYFSGGRTIVANREPALDTEEEIKMAETASNTSTPTGTEETVIEESNLPKHVGGRSF